MQIKLLTSIWAAKEMINSPSAPSGRLGSSMNPENTRVCKETASGPGVTLVSWAGLWLARGGGWGARGAELVSSEDSQSGSHGRPMALVACFCSRLPQHLLSPDPVCSCSNGGVRPVMGEDRPF